MHTRLLALLAALPLIAAGCGGATPLAAGGDAVLPAIGHTGAPTTRRDPAEIVEARVEGDRLHLRVRFGGGCAEHEFALVRGEVFRESLPVQLDLALAHDARGDACRALLERDLAFDLAPVKRFYRASYGAGAGTVMLHLHPPAPEVPAPLVVRYDF